MSKVKNITNEVVTEYLDSFYKPLNEELGSLREEAERDGVPIILRDAEMFLMNLLRVKKPLKILEIGTAVGYSASCFATVTGGKVVSIESDEATHEKALKNIEKLKLSDRISVILGKGQDVLDSLDETGFDFVFIDAAKSHYKAFFDGAVNLCSKDAVIVSDNVLLKGGSASDDYDPTGRFKTNIKNMRKYNEYLCSLDYADTSIVSVGDGIAVTVLHR